MNLDSEHFLVLLRVFSKSFIVYRFNFLNPLLHRLFLDHDIIFYFFLTTLKKLKKNLSYVLYTFENIMENGAFAPKEQMLHFSYFQIHDISKVSKGIFMV